MRYAACLFLLSLFTLPASAAPLPHPSKPLLLDLLDQYRGQWRHPGWLGQTMELPGAAGGIFPLNSPSTGGKPQLGLITTPSSAPDKWSAASVQWMSPGSEGRCTWSDPHWRITVQLGAPSRQYWEARLIDLRFDQAFLSPHCPAGLLLKTSDGQVSRLRLLPEQPTPRIRLETDAVGNLLVGASHIRVRLISLGELPSRMYLVLTDYLTQREITRTKVTGRFSAGQLNEWETQITAPTLGVFVLRLQDEAGQELAQLRLTRIAHQTRKMTPQQSHVGINLFQHQLWSYTFQLPMIAATGARWVRPWLAWENTWRTQEPADGRFDFTQMEHMISRCEQFGLAYEAILFSSPERIGGSGLLQSPPPPDKLHRWRRWVHALASRFRGRIGHYEAWNEPDMMWPGTAGENADQYVALLRATHDAVRSADPDAHVDAPSSAGYRRWLQESVRLGAPALTDVFTFHTYAQPASFLYHVRSRLDLWGGADGWDRPAWLNEIGAPACDLNPEYNQKLNGSELAQAQTLIANMALYLTERPEGKVFWFCSLDPHDPHRPSDWHPEKYAWDAGIGVLYEGLLPKMSYVALNAVARLLDHRQGLGHWQPAPSIHIAAFSGRLAVLFDDRLQASQPVQATELGCAPTERLTVYDLYGNRLARADASRLVLDLRRGPLFIEGSARWEQIARLHGLLRAIRPPMQLPGAAVALRAARLPEGAQASVRIGAPAGIMSGSLTGSGRRLHANWEFHSRAPHALAFVTLSARQRDLSVSQVHPVTIGALSLYDDPGFCTDPYGLWQAERGGGLTWDREVGHLAPGSLRSTAPHNGRMVNWQQWYLAIRPDKPIFWSVWLKAERLSGAKLHIGLARFSKEGWLGDTLLVSPDACPSGSRDWVEFTGTITPDQLGAGFTHAALYIDVSPDSQHSPDGTLWIDELDLWQ